MNNACAFSPCRRYRYTLEHVIDPALPVRRIMWIGLNPSTADENRLDPTLRRIRRFSADWGFTAFVMTNLFAFRATDPAVMKRAADPVGPLNDVLLQSTAQSCEAIVAAWGTHGGHRSRADAVLRIFHSSGHRVDCIALTKDGSPKHPLYVAASATRYPYPGEGGQ